MSAPSSTGRTTADPPRQAEPGGAAETHDWKRLATTPEFLRLHASRRRFTAIGMVIETGAVILLMALLGFAPDAMGEPARAAMVAARTKSSRTASMSARVISRGTWLRGDHATADGPMTGQLPSGSGASASSHPSCVDPFGPECPSCTPILASVSAWTKSTMRVQAASCAGEYRPVQPGEIRPSGDTHVISVMTSPAPPLARSP